MYADAPGITVRVRDSGPGVAPEIEHDVFREGFSTKGGGGHRGLGLALVRQVAQKRGGWVRASREDGSSFTAVLPSPDPVRT